VNHKENIESKEKRIKRDECVGMKVVAEFFVGLASLFAILQYVFVFMNPQIALSVTPSGVTGLDVNGTPSIMPAINLKNLGTEVPIRYNVETSKHTILYGFKLYGSESPDLIKNDNEINTCGFKKSYNNGTLVFPGSEMRYNLFSVCLGEYPGYQRYELYSNISIKYSNADYDNVMKSCEYTATYVFNTGTGANYPRNDKYICTTNTWNFILNEKYVILVILGFIIVLILGHLFNADKESKLKK
jgi:hypothetical protein